VHWSAELLRSGTLGVESRCGATTGGISAGGVRTATGTSRGSAARRGGHIDGCVAERTPLPLERAGIGIEHDDAAVPIAVGHECLIRLRPHKHVRRLMHRPRVSVALADAPAADLQQELSLVVELQEHVIVEIAKRRCDGGAAANPHMVLVVDGDAVLAVRPVIAVAGSAPRVHELSRRVELEHRRRRVLAAILGNRVRPVQHPHVIVAIDRDGCDVTDDPVVRQLRPGGVHFEDGNLSPWRLRLCATVRERRNRCHHEDACSDDAEIPPR
jgi:hypothetical protein